MLPSLRTAAAMLAAVAGLMSGTPTFSQEDPGPEDPLPTRPVPWHHAFGLASSAGVLNPGVLVGFNPQPEPPARLAELSFLYPPDPILILRDQRNPPGGLQVFDVFLALLVPGTHFGFSAPEVLDTDHGQRSVRTRATTGGVPVLDIYFDIMSSSGGLLDPASLVGFNPQPEPPGAFGAGGFGMSFGIDSLSDAMVRVRAFDMQGQALTFTAVPEPAGLALAGLAAALLVHRRRRG